MTKTYLIHHGVKGQRWGVRRYQNEDGSLTPKGKKHIDGLVKKDEVKEAKKVVRNDSIKKGAKTAGIVMGIVGGLTLLGSMTEWAQTGVNPIQQGKELVDLMRASRGLSVIIKKSVGG